MTNLSQEQAAAIAELQRLNKLRQIAVVSALVLLVLSFIRPGSGIALLRSAAWCAAGVLSLSHTSKAKKLGLQASYVNAVLYLVVAVIPLLRMR